MAKRKAETSNEDGDKKKPKESASTCLERSSTPRIPEVDGKALKIISFNVAGLRGLLNSVDKKTNFLSIIHEENPDVIALQEHKLQEVHVDSEGQVMKELLPNYQQFWACSTEKKGYSGVAIFVRSIGKSGLKQRSVKDFFGSTANTGNRPTEKGECPTTLKVEFGLERMMKVML